MQRDHNLISPGSSAVAFTLLILVPGLFTGCASATPRVLSIDLQAAEKDVLVCRIELDSPVAPEGYADWAEQNISEIGAQPRNPFYETTPVYEFIYAFHAGGKRLATVQYRVGEDDPERNLKYVRTNVYHGRDGGR
jgi:hypothetical protein